jgi:hypothetical protein
LLTSILDDPTGDQTQQLWNIYYHSFLDPASAPLLQIQAAKLVAQAQSLKAWEASSYAQFVEFGDSTTFAKVVEPWKVYATAPADKEQYKELQVRLRAQWQFAKRLREDGVNPNGLQLTDGRSFAPVLQEAPGQLDKMYRTFWRTGTCLENEETISQLTVGNPMFVCLRDGLVLHYETSPLIGFHLGAAYVRLSTDSPLQTSEEKIREMPKPLAAALKQFSAWCKAFRLIATKVKVRYICSEAIALCHVLRHQRLHRESQTANWYRSNWGYSLLELDATCYGLNGKAPTSFDVIDTSNLVDHLGILNVLVAAGPLLLNKMTSSIRTEMVILQETTVSESAKAMLSGDLPTVALLLGLKPAHFWSDATASWHVHDSIGTGSPIAEALVSSLSRRIILWGPAGTPKVEWVAPALVDFVFKLHQTMFQDESLHSLLELLGTRDQTLLARKLQTHQMYSRASLAVILLHIKNSGAVEWRPFIERFLDMVVEDRSLIMGGHSYQSLLVYIHMLGLADLATFANWHPVHYPKDLQKGPFRSWSTVPPTVCVTMAVPHSAVAMFADLSNNNGTPQCHIMTQSSLSAKQNVYPDIQLGFGTITTSSTKFTDDYTLNIQEDPRGWSGQASLIVSTMVSTLGLVFEGDPACLVKLCLKSTPSVASKFSSKLGIFLELYGSAVGRKDVHITRHRPHMTGDVSVGAIEEGKSGLGKLTFSLSIALPPHGLIMRTEDNFPVTLRPGFDSTGGMVSTLTVQFKISSAKVVGLLQAGGSVDVQFRDPFSLVMNIQSGNDLYQDTVQLPMPLESGQGKSKIARKSLWIEYSAPVAESAYMYIQPNVLFPLRKDSRYAGNTHSLDKVTNAAFRSSCIELDQLHYVCPDVLPILDVSAEAPNAHWLKWHTSGNDTMSVLERDQYRKIKEKGEVPTGRMAIKDRVFHMMSGFANLNDTPQCSIFIVEDSHGTVAMVMIHAIRMDLSNQTVFLDAASIPILKILPTGFLAAMEKIPQTGAVTFKASAQEALFWKHLLPAFAERCRQ